MFTNSGKSKSGGDHAVHTTGVPLSERFKCVPSHNPLRPNFGIKCVVEEDMSTETYNFGGLRGFNGENVQLSKLAGVNKLAVVKAKKDAEIIQLRSQVGHLQAKLKRLGNGGGPGIGMEVKPTRKHNHAFMKRLGGGYILGQRGKHLNIQSQRALEVLGVKRISMNPPATTSRKNNFRNNRNNNNKNNNFFGSPKSREDLDTELDAYMSKSKSKQKTDLDKELDEYMTVARSQSFAGRAGLLAPLADQNATAESEDTDMEIVEAL